MKITKTQLRKIIKEELKEAGRPHSMRSGRSMGDLDREAKTRETDYLPSKSIELDLTREELTIWGDMFEAAMQTEWYDQVVSTSAYQSLLNKYTTAQQE